MSPEYSKIILEQLRTDAVGQKAGEILRNADQYLEEHVVIATSFSVEDQVIVDLAVKNQLNLKVITLDTGRLFPETYELWAQTEKHYGIRIDGYYPKSNDVENFVKRVGINGFRESIEKRKECCAIRKIEPLTRALTGRQAWVCGLRQQQGVTRETVEAVQIGRAHV